MYGREGGGEGLTFDVGHVSDLKDFLTIGHWRMVVRATGSDWPR